MSDLRIFIGNLPEKFSQDDLHKLLSSANVSSNSPLTINQPAEKSGRVAKTRYSIIAFDSEEEARNAKDSLNGAYITTTENDEKGEIREKKHDLKVNFFISNFKEKTLNNNICIRNLPSNFDKSKVEKAYKSFGKILSVEVHNVEGFKNASGADVPPRKTGYVLFNEAEETNKAIANTNGKFLGKNQLIVTKFIPRNERLKNPCTIHIKGLPSSMTDEALIKFLTEEIQSNLPEENKFVLQSAKKPTVGKSDKYKTKWAIVELVSNTDAVKAKNALNDYVIEEANPENGSKEAYKISVNLHYSRAARKMISDQNKLQIEKDFKNERSVFIKSVRLDVKSEEFKAKIAELINGDASNIEQFEPVEDHTGTKGTNFRIRFSSVADCEAIKKAAKENKFEGYEFVTMENGQEVKKPVTVSPFEMKESKKERRNPKQSEETKH